MLGPARVQGVRQCVGSVSESGPAHLVESVSMMMLAPCPCPCLCLWGSHGRKLRVKRNVGPISGGLKSSGCPSSQLFVQVV